ncbi:hypothetical protein Fcan01_22194, partial [Folsomia candida]
FNHDQAVAYCTGLNMELVSLESEAEHSYVRQISPASGPYRQGAVIDWTKYSIKQWHPSCILMNRGGLWADPCDGSLGHVYYPVCQHIPAEEEEVVDSLTDFENSGVTLQEQDS